jgi:hypothetical protein
MQSLHSGGRERRTELKDIMSYEGDLIKKKKKRKERNNQEGTNHPLMFQKCFLM